jgi:hypothetical protein
MACKTHRTRWCIGWGSSLVLTQAGDLIEDVPDDVSDPDFKLWQDLGVEGFADVDPLLRA